VTNIAHAAQILEETIEYAKERKAFGQSIGNFQHNKFLLAELVTKIEVAQAFIDQAVAAHDKGELTPIDAAKAKWWSAEVQNDVLDHCVSCSGYGYERVPRRPSLAGRPVTNLGRTNEIKELSAVTSASGDPSAREMTRAQRLGSARMTSSVFSVI
jgi:alkylation response protein AidB-like acyl-CoA dehydrogenase